MRIALVHRGVVAGQLQALAAVVAAGGHDLAVAELVSQKQKEWSALVREADCVLIAAPPSAEAEARVAFEQAGRLGRDCLVMPELEILRVQRFLLALKFRAECERRETLSRRPPRFKRAWA